MSAALAIAEPFHPPGPTQDRPAAVASAAAPCRITRILVLIRWIISYGTELASTLHQRATQPSFQSFVRRYRKRDLAVIFARIKRGLIIAGALEAKLAARAAKGRDIAPPPLRMPPPHAPRSDAAKQPRAPRRTNFVDLPIDRLPTAEEIASELRRRPLGAILVDICRDLGMLPGDMPGAQWEELSDIITFYDGNVATLTCREFNGWLRDNRARLLGSGGEPAPPVEHQDATPVLSTGPP